MVSTVITKCNGNDSVIDFRDKLSLSQIDNYATMHQLGGKKNKGTVYPSVIEMVICDYSKGTGDKSVTVSVNFEPSLFYEWYEVCKASLGDYAVPLIKSVKNEDDAYAKPELVPNELCEIKNNSQHSRNVGAALLYESRGFIEILKKILSGGIKVGSTEFYKEIGACIKEKRNILNTPPKESKYLKIARGVEYSYSQDKVNIYKKGSDGYAPVSRVIVNHQPIRSIDGDASKYPWVFKITNGEAAVIDKSSGATTFKTNTLRNVTEASIKVSERDMFRMMTRVTHFINTWENAMCIPLIIQGEKRKAEEFGQNREVENE